MSFMDKLKFWKKDDDFSFGSSPGSDNLGLGSDPALSQSGFDPNQYDTSNYNSNLGMPDMNQQQDSFGQHNQWQQNAFQSQNQGYQSQQNYGRQQQFPQHMQHGQQGYQVVEPQQNNNNNNSYNNPSNNRDMEIVSLKLDSLRASIDSLNQRLSNIEQMLRSRRNW